jgi:hypothetical protein
MAGSRLQQVAAGRQTGQRGLQILAFRALPRQFPDELLEVGARMRQAGDVVEKRAIRHSLDFTCNASRRVTLLSRPNSRLLQPGELFHPPGFTRLTIVLDGLSFELLPRLKT